MFSLAGSSEEKCARDATITLGNLAVVTRNQVAITNAGGLRPLVNMLINNPYVSCQKFAARALYRVAAHGDNKPKIVAEGALPPLVQRLRSPDAEVARCVGVRVFMFAVLDLSEYEIRSLEDRALCLPLQ